MLVGEGFGAIEITTGSLLRLRVLPLDLKDHFLGRHFLGIWLLPDHIVEFLKCFPELILTLLLFQGLGVTLEGLDGVITGFVVLAVRL